MSKATENLKSTYPKGYNPLKVALARNFSTWTTRTTMNIVVVLDTSRRGSQIVDFYAVNAHVNGISKGEEGWASDLEDMNDVADRLSRAIRFNVNPFYPTKSAAATAARKLAKDIGVAFDGDLDVDILDITHGKTVACEACGETKQRSFAPFVCVSCRSKIAMAEDSFGERIPVDLYLGDLMGWYGKLGEEAGEVSKRIGQAIITLSGAKKDERYISQQLDRELGQRGVPTWTGLRREYGPKEKVRVSMTENQAKAADEIVRAMIEYTKMCMAKGFENGDNLLVNLASGKKSIVDYEQDKNGRVRDGR